MMDLGLKWVIWLQLAAYAAAETQCQSLTSQFPSCVAGCITSAASSAGCTNTADLACGCEPSMSKMIQAAAVPCALSSCTSDMSSIMAGITAGSALCNCVNSATAPAQLLPETGRPFLTSTAGPQETNLQSPSAGHHGLPRASFPKFQLAAPGLQARDAEITSEDCVSKQDCTSVALSAVDTCALNCFFSHAPDIGCSALDLACQCQPSAQAAMTRLMAGCLFNECPLLAIPGIIWGAGSICDCVTASPTGNICPEELGALGLGDAAMPEPTEKPIIHAEFLDGANRLAAAAPDCTKLAQSVVPQCARDCYKANAAKIECGELDFKCQCEPEAQKTLSDILAPCVLAGCNVMDIPQVISGGKSVCDCATGAARTKTQDLWDEAGDAVIGHVTEDASLPHGHMAREFVLGAEMVMPERQEITEAPSVVPGQTLPSYTSSIPIETPGSSSVPSTDEGGAAGRFGLGVSGLMLVATLLVVAAL